MAGFGLRLARACVGDVQVLLDPEHHNHTGPIFPTFALCLDPEESGAMDVGGTANVNV